MTRSSLIPLILAVVAIIVSLMLGRYGAYLAHVVAIAAIGAMSLNLLNGWCGQINFAQAALLGVGAYTAGNFGNAGWDVFSLLAAGIASALAAVLIGLPALRLRGLYFAIATLAAQFIFEYLFKFAEPITHGVSGLLIQPMRLFGRVIDTDQSYAVLAICLLLLTWFFMTWIRRTDLGRAFLVVRENEVVARGMAAMRALIELGIARGEIRNEGLTRFPQIVVAPAIVAVSWKSLFERHSPLDALEMFRVHLDLIFGERRTT